MSSKKGRLDGVEAGLSGRQMALMEIKRELSFGTMANSVRESLTRKRKEPSLCDRIGERIEASMKGADRSEIWKSIKPQQREALFLMHLWNGCNRRVNNDDALHRAKSAHLTTKLMLLLKGSRANELSQTCMEARRQERSKPGKQAGNTWMKAPTFMSELARFESHAVQVDEWIQSAFSLAAELLTELYQTRFSIEWLSANYFDGQPLLFGDLRTALRGLLAATIHNVRLLNRVVAFAHDDRLMLEYLRTDTVDDAIRPPALVVRTVKETASTSLHDVVRRQIDSAMAEAHAAMDEDEDAAQIHRRLANVS